MACNIHTANVRTVLVTDVFVKTVIANHHQKTAVVTSSLI